MDFKEWLQLDESRRRKDGSMPAAIKCKIEGCDHYMSPKEYKMRNGLCWEHYQQLAMAG